MSQSKWKNVKKIFTGCFLSLDIWKNECQNALVIFLLQFYYSKYLTMEAKFTTQIHALAIGMSCINTFCLDYDVTSLNLFWHPQWSVWVRSKVVFSLPGCWRYVNQLKFMKIILEVTLLKIKVSPPMALVWLYWRKRKRSQINVTSHLLSVSWI